MNNGQKTILLLNITAADAGSFYSLIGENANFIKADSVDSALRILSETSVDLILTDASKRSALLRKTVSDDSISSIPVLSVERSFSYGTPISLFDKETEERLLKNIDETMEELERNRYYERFAYDALPVAIIMYYLDWRPMPYISGNLFLLFGYSTEEVLQMQQNGLGGLVNADDLAKANRNLSESHAQGKDRVVNEYRMYKKDGSVAYVQEIASRFSDEDGSIGYISVLTDITERHKMLEQLRFNERVMRTVSEHSERVIYYYDIAKDELRSVNVDVAMRAGLADFCVDPMNTLDALSLVHTDCNNSLGILFNDIKSGKKSGSMKLHMTCLDGIDRWFDLCYTSAADSSGSTVGAVISLLDVTQQHDYEISYARYQQNLDNAILDESVFFEFDLTDNIVEKQVGKVEPFNEIYIDRPYTDTVNYMTENIGNRKEQRRIRTYLELDKLLAAYNSAQRRISDDWKITLDEGCYIWLHCSVQLVDDPYTGHIKMYMSLRDVTEKKLKQLNILHQAENDGLTGLYNRSTIENKIEESLLDGYENSVFIIIDLDDLKYINDTLGHAQGDRAICAISDELISTFKQIGIEGRLGGDEFLVFIPNYSDAESLDSLISGLLRRLTAITIGENDDRSLHCSIGISIADKDAHDFASLYKRADIALYHVKSNGKNDYAFFDESMLDVAYRYKSFEFTSFRKSTLFENLEFRRIMNAFALFYPQIVMSNVTKNTSCVLVSSGAFENKIPAESSMDDLSAAVSASIHPDFREKMLEATSRAGMLAAYESGKNAVYYHCRLNDTQNGEQRWIAFLTLFYKNDDGDICLLSLVRNATEHTIHHETSRVRLALELAAEAGIAFTCAVYPANNSYDIICGAYENIPAHGSFDEVLAPLCEMSLGDISKAVSNGQHCSCSFAGGEKTAHFALADAYSGEITMLVSFK